MALKTGGSQLSPWMVTDDNKTDHKKEQIKIFWSSPWSLRIFFLLHPAYGMGKKLTQVIFLGDFSKDNRNNNAVIASGSAAIKINYTCTEKNLILKRSSRPPPKKNLKKKKTNKKLSYFLEMEEFSMQLLLPGTERMWHSPRPQSRSWHASQLSYQPQCTHWDLALGLPRNYSVQNTSQNILVHHFSFLRIHLICLRDQQSNNNGFGAETCRIPNLSKDYQQRNRC